MFDHKPVSLADQVFEKIETDILCGKYRRGEILTELGLSSELGVSRTPVREALRMLSQEHLIEERAKGAVVIGITNEDVRDIFDIRLKIESEAVARAAQRITPEEIEQLREALELQEFYVQKKDAEHIKANDSRFHHLLYRFSGSTIYEDILDTLHKKAQRYRRASIQNESRAAASCAEHRAIFECVAAHDAEGARRAAQLHTKNAAFHIVTEEK